MAGGFLELLRSVSGDEPLSDKTPPVEPGPLGAARPPGLGRLPAAPPVEPGLLAAAPSPGPGPLPAATPPGPGRLDAAPPPGPGHLPAATPPGQGGLSAATPPGQGRLAAAPTPGPGRQGAADSSAWAPGYRRGCMWATRLARRRVCSLILTQSHVMIFINLR